MFFFSITYSKSNTMNNNNSFLSKATSFRSQYLLACTQLLTFSRYSFRGLPRFLLTKYSCLSLQSFDKNLTFTYLIYFISFCYPSPNPHFNSFKMIILIFRKSAVFISIQNKIPDKCPCSFFLWKFFFTYGYSYFNFHCTTIIFLNSAFQNCLTCCIFVFSVLISIFNFILLFPNTNISLDLF